MTNQADDTRKWTRCPHCGVDVLEQNLDRHLRRKHRKYLAFYSGHNQETDVPKRRSNMNKEQFLQTFSDPDEKTPLAQHLNCPFCHQRYSRSYYRKHIKICPKRSEIILAETKDKPKAPAPSIQSMDGINVNVSYWVDEYGVVRSYGRSKSRPRKKKSNRKDKSE